MSKHDPGRPAAEGSQGPARPQTARPQTAEHHSGAAQPIAARNNTAQGSTAQPTDAAALRGHPPASARPELGTNLGASLRPAERAPPRAARVTLPQPPHPIASQGLLPDTPASQTQMNARSTRLAPDAPASRALLEERPAMPLEAPPLEPTPLGAAAQPGAPAARGTAAPPPPGTGLLPDDQGSLPPGLPGRGFRVLVVEDVTEARSALAELVAEAFPEAQVTEAADRRSGLEAARLPHDLALIDLGLPDGSGLDVLRRMTEDNPNAICIVTTVMADDAHIVAALSSGAEGYLLKGQPAGVLVRQLRQATRGIPALSPVIARRIMQHFRLTGPASHHDSALTQRETEVLALIGRGLRNGEVANALGLSENTVAGYIKAVYRKLGISSRAEASWHATQMGLSWVGNDPQGRGGRG